MPEKSAFMFHHDFFPKPKIYLKDAENIKRLGKTISIITRYDAIVSMHSSDIVPINLEEMTIDTDQNLPLLQANPTHYPITPQVCEGRNQKFIRSILKAQTTQTRSKGSLALIETA